MIAKPSLEEGVAVICMNRAQGTDECFRQETLARTDECFRQETLAQEEQELTMAEE